ncbi:MAG TPA: hypothetical protein DCS88_01995 [Alphaproteobacteria bacterium]|nr:hypothetical protein [Alphaproteobacteria bacterium]
MNFMECFTCPWAVWGAWFEGQAYSGPALVGVRLSHIVIAVLLMIPFTNLVFKQRYDQETWKNYENETPWNY